MRLKTFVSFFIKFIMSKKIANNSANIIQPYGDDNCANYQYWINEVRTAANDIVESSVATLSLNGGALIGALGGSILSDHVMEGRPPNFFSEVQDVALIATIGSTISSVHILLGSLYTSVNADVHQGVHDKVCKKK
jgi:hypothetical protein